jgi:hypothetical protein
MGKGQGRFPVHGAAVPRLALEHELLLFDCVNCRGQGNSASAFHGVGEGRLGKENLETKTDLEIKEEMGSSVNKGRPMKRILFVLLLLATTVAEGTKLPPPDPEPGKGAIGISIAFGSLLSTKQVTEVYFVRLDDNTKGYFSAYFTKPNYSSRGQLYLLNTEPGRYVAVGALITGDDPGYWTGKVWIPGSGHSEEPFLFSEETIARTEVTVGPDEMVLMGNFLGEKVVHKRGSRHPDGLEEYYYRLARGTPLVPKKIKGLQLAHVGGKLESERAFWTKAHDKVFDDYPAWQDQIRHQLKRGVEDSREAIRD